MHYRLKAMAVVLITCPALTPVCAQFADSTGKVIPAIDTVPRKVSWSTPVTSNVFPLRSFIIPAAFIAYGVTSLGYHELKDFNNNLKEEIAMEHPHKALTIDNYL